MRVRPYHVAQPGQQPGTVTMIVVVVFVAMPVLVIVAASRLAVMAVLVARLLALVAAVGSVRGAAHVSQHAGKGSLQHIDNQG